MKSRTIRAWSAIHRWSSLVCMLFMLLLCVTGLPLIFHHEIDHLLMPARPALVPGTSAPSLEAVVLKAQAARPGQVVNYIYFVDDAPHAMVATAERRDSLPGDTHYQLFDLRDGLMLEHRQPTEGFMYVVAKLHVDLFAGMKGMLFLGAMALLLLLAIASGVVLYAPFMRKLGFATLRDTRGPRVLWLDVHNLLGIVTAAWLGVVGFTGAINTLAMPVEMLWQSTELAQMAAHPPDRAAGAPHAAVDDVLGSVLTAAPGKTVRTLAFPGTPFASPHHFGVYLVGDAPLTSRLLSPALVDAGSARVVDMRDMPLYAKALFLSQPLHFGDYGGMPLKIIWAILDVLSIVVLASGIYLWLRKPRAALASAAGRRRQAPQERAA
ncbi:PepSY domain-containing protein [Xylophilus sp. GW821-FHT01B05]